MKTLLLLLGYTMPSYIMFLGGRESAVQKLLSIKAHSTTTNASFHTQPQQAKATVACGCRKPRTFQEQHRTQCQFTAGVSHNSPPCSQSLIPVLTCKSSSCKLETPLSEQSLVLSYNKQLDTGQSGQRCYFRHQLGTSVSTLIF